MVKLSFSIPDLSALGRQGFVADMHYHTCHSHDCRTPVKEIIRRARKLGIWVAFTDHNSIGGVLEARKFKDAPVIPGVELCSSEGKEVIAYFYDDRDLEKYFDREIAPRVKQKNPLRSSRTPIPMKRLISSLEKERCLVHLPHPFAPQPRRSYMFFNRTTRSHLLDSVDSIEVFNSMVLRKGNLTALGWATQLQKGAAGGSDGHLLKDLGRAVTLSRATTPQEHLDHIRRGSVEVFGLELKPHERAIGYAQGSVQTKLRRGVRGGLQKGLSLPRRALEHW